MASVAVGTPQLPTADNFEVQTTAISKAGSTIETQGGTITVKPYRSKGSTQIHAQISFTPRVSHFDTWENAPGSADTFRGFFTLFWIVMFIMAIRTYVVSFDQIGSPLNFNFAMLFSKHAWALGVSDGVLVGSTFICVPFVKALQKGWIPYYWTGVVIQHIWQTGVLGIAVTWTFNRYDSQRYFNDAAY